MNLTRIRSPAKASTTSRVATDIKVTGRTMLCLAMESWTILEEVGNNDLH